MSSPESVVLPDGRRIGDLKVADLRTQLELRGLSRSGVKKDLCARLSDAVGGELVLEEKKSGSTVEPMGSNSSLDDNSTQNEDTLEINAVASDEEIFEVSAPGDTGNAEKEIPRSEESICKSPSASSECTMGTLNDIEKPTGIANANTTENTETSDQLAPTEDNKSETEVQPQRRRQWGSRSISSTPSLSSESLEKLIPPSACWVRSKSLVVDTENEAQSNDPMVLQDITEHDEAIKYPTVPDEKLEPSSIKDESEPDHVEGDGVNNRKQSSGDNHDEVNRMLTVSSGCVQLEREVELEVDAVVENMDADDSAIEETTGAYDSRTVHLSTDISPKLDVIIKRGSVNASANAHVNNHPTVKQSTDGTSSVHLNSSQSNPSSTTIKNKSPPSKRKGPKETKAVGYLVEPPERIEPVQPSKHPQTDIVYIRFLVRPFTAEQLRQMISTHFGSVVDLWLDKIKSSSLVRLQTAELAAKCREGLDGSRWPSMNPRVLRCDYASTDLFEWMKVNGDNNDVQPPKHLLLGETSLLMSETAVSSKTVEKSDNEFIGSTERNTKSTDLRRKLERTNRDLEPTEVTKPRQSEIKDSPVTDMKLAKGEEPAKLLNNLFRKTTATPSIYWLPLTDQQVNRRTKKAVAEKSDDKKVTSRHSSRHSEEPGQRTTRSPFGVTSSPPLPPSNNMSSQSSRKDFNADRSTGSKNSDDKRLPTTKSNDNGRHVSNKKSLQNNALSEDKHSTSECKPKSTAESKSENRDTADKQGRLLKPDAGIAHSSSSKTDKLMDVSRKKEPSSPSHAEKRRPPKTENSDNEIMSSKQSRTAVAPSGDSSVVSDALAAYKRNVVGSQQHRSEYRRRSPSGRRSPPNHRSSFKNSRPESSRAREQGSHCRSNVARRRSRSNDRRNRSRSTGRRDRSLSDRYRSRN